MQSFLDQCNYIHTSSVLPEKCWSLVHINIRSLPKNFDSLLSLIQETPKKPDLILITETWADTQLASHFQIENYTLETSGQPETRGRGTAIYISDSLLYSRRGDLESSVPEFQSVFLEIQNQRSKNSIIGSLYRSPSFPVEPFVDYINGTASALQRENKLSILGGDFNINLLNLAQSNCDRMFFNSMLAAGFLPCISLPTRITSSSNSLIDNFFVNDMTCVSNNSVFISDISDHLPITISIPYSRPPLAPNHHKHTSFDFRKVESLKQNISIKLPEILGIAEAEEAAAFLLRTIRNEISKLSIKKFNRKKVPIQPWISHGLLRSINKKKNLHKKFIRSPTPQNERIFKDYRNALVSAIRTSKKMYINRKLTEYEENPRKMWEILLQLVHKNSKVNIPSSFESDGITTQDPQLIANHFNSFFSTIGKSLDEKLCPSSSDPMTYLSQTSGHGNSFHFNFVWAEIVLNIIMGLKKLWGRVRWHKHQNSKTYWTSYLIFLSIRFQQMHNSRRIPTGFQVCPSCPYL